MDRLIAFHNALADSTRWRIVQLIFDRALCVCELADILGMPQSSVSSHLQVIKKAQLLESERCEKWIYYRLDPQYLTIVKMLGEMFDANLRLDITIKNDALKASKRLKQSAENCCPRPKKLLEQKLKNLTKERK